MPKLRIKIIAITTWDTTQHSRTTSMDLGLFYEDAHPPRLRLSDAAIDKCVENECDVNALKGRE